MVNTQSDNKNVHLLYKNLGETPNETILRFKKDHPDYTDIPMTYAGRLDPMAEGLLLVLSGDEVNKKDEYLGLNKTYEFEILWGFETDTLDVLGLVQMFDDAEVSKEDVIEMINKSIGKLEQKYPIYSSKPVNGKSLWQWAREGKILEIQIPKHEVEILEASFISRREIGREELIKEISKKVNLVSGDFRQEQVVQSWNMMLSSVFASYFFVDKISINVSSGFYVRQFVNDLARELNTSAVTFQIKRNMVGEFCND